MTSPIVAKLRYMARQYTSGSVARGGSPGKHYLDEAADRIEELEALADSEGTRAVEYLRRARAAEKALREAQPAGMVPLDNDDVLWLWRDGDKMLAFRHLYPCYSPGGDPMTLGEPWGKAIFRHSHDRAASPAQPAAPAVEPLTPRELELIDGMIEVQLHHARQCDGIANRVMADKQKGWDMERVALLRKLRGITQGEQHG